MSAALLRIVHSAGKGTDRQAAAESALSLRMPIAVIPSA